MRFFKSPSQKYESVRFRVSRITKSHAVDEIAIAAIIKNESAFIKEWLRFHSAAGVDHFFLYDDCSTDDTIKIAKETLPTNQLSIIPWCQRIQDASNGKALHNQGLAFSHAISNFGGFFRWMCFIDVDEFLFPTEAISLKEVLLSMPHVDNIYLPWHMFGRQGYIDTPDFILPNYTTRMADAYSSETKGVLNFKCVVDPRKVTKVYVHGFETENFPNIFNSAGQEFKAGQHKSRSFQNSMKLQLNHYYIKSDAHLSEKIHKGSIGDSTFTKKFKNKILRKNLITQRLLEIERNSIEDSSIIDYCDKIGFNLH